MSEATPQPSEREVPSVSAMWQVTPARLSAAGGPAVRPAGEWMAIPGRQVGPLPDLMDRSNHRAERKRLGRLVPPAGAYDPVTAGLWCCRVAALQSDAAPY